MLHPIFIAIALLLFLSGQASATQTAFKLVAENAGEKSYSGHSTIHGEYGIFEDGELCFLIKKSQGSKIPLANGTTKVCFANREAALLALQLNQQIKIIDLKTICGLEGTATINIQGLTTGVGPTSRWFTTTLASASLVSKPKRVACHG